MSKKMFDIKPQVLQTPEQAYAVLMGASSDNQVLDIPLNLIDEIKNQSFHIRESKIESIAESIKIVGQLDPVIVIKNPNITGRYVLIAGRHRCRACELLGKETVKAIVKEENNEDKQRLMLLSSNNDRNNDYLPSELAFSYLEQKQLLEKLGSKSTTDKIAESSGTNRKSVHRYIQLTKLNNALLYKVDNGVLTVGAGYELSYLSHIEQEKINLYLINNPETHITKETARLIRENPDEIDNIVNPSENKTDVKQPTKNSQQKSVKQKDDNDDSSHPSLDNKIKYVIGQALYKSDAYFKQIITNFLSTDELVKYLDKQCFNHSFYKGTILSNCKYADFREKWIQIYFKTKHCNITLDNHHYSLTLKEVDNIVREYIRTLLTFEIIEIFNGK